MKLFPNLMLELRLSVLIKYLLFRECEDGHFSFTRRKSYVTRFRNISAILVNRTNLVHNFAYMFIVSTCFGQLCEHHQEKIPDDEPIVARNM
jgi:hypothetical protein